MSRSRSTALALAASAALLATVALGRRRRFPVRGKVALITGGSRGLGLAIAETFGRAGARLILVARHGEELVRAKRLLVERGISPHDVFTAPCDVADADAVRGLVEGASALAGAPVEILINVAGVIVVGPVENQPLSAFREAMEINYFGAVHTALALLPGLLARAPGGDGSRGHIVNISSIGGKLAVPHLLPYSGSKFALTGFSEGLHAELKGKGIHVTTVCPGLMRTGSPGKALVVGRRAEEFRWFHLGASLPGVAASAEHAARVILAAVERGTAEVTITPQAALGALANGVAPGVISAVLGLVNEHVLPAPAPGGPMEPEPGGAHREKAVRGVTGAGDVAEARWNQ